MRVLPFDLGWEASRRPLPAEVLRTGQLTSRLLLGGIEVDEEVFSAEAQAAVMQPHTMRFNQQTMALELNRKQGDSDRDRQGDSTDDPSQDGRTTVRFLES